MRAKILSAVQERTRKARELLAADLFDWERVMAAIGAAAGQGFDTVTLEPEQPVNLRATKAAAATVARLQELEFRCLWVMRRHRPDAPDCPALEITWPLGEPPLG